MVSRKQKSPNVSEEDDTLKIQTNVSFDKYRKIIFYKSHGGPESEI